MSWDKLSMQERADVMKLAVANGIYNLDTIRSAYNEFAEGGGIHIKPSHRGRLTELKERTGKTEAELKHDGNPAHKKMVVFAENARKWKHGLGGNLFDEGGTTEERPPIIPFTQRREVIITPDSEYNRYLNTLPDNQRFTPNSKYDSYLYWKLNDKPKDFKEAYDRGMFNYDHSDNAYHANSIAWGKDGIGYFMKPKNHPTVRYETDWFNKGLVTEEGGWQRPETFFEWRDIKDFKDNYELVDDPNRPNFLRYQPKKKALGGHIYDGTSEESQQMTTGMPWQDDWLTDEDAQMIEQQRHPLGHNLEEIAVTAKMPEHLKERPAIPPASSEFVQTLEEVNQEKFSPQIFQTEEITIPFAPKNPSPKVYRKLDIDNTLYNNEYLNSGAFDQDLQNKFLSMDKEQIMAVQAGLAAQGFYDLNSDNMTEKEIKNIQSKLYDKGFLKGDKNKAVDGIVGPKTIEAWRQYNIDGIPGKRTMEAFKSQYSPEARWKENVSTENTEWCAQWVSKKVKNASGDLFGVSGDAWTMPQHIVEAGGEMLYNIYNNDAFSSVSNVGDLKRTTEKAIKEEPFDISQLQLGDIVGIYMPSSDMHSVALSDGTTYNTHVGVVTGFDKDGTPIIEHNIHKKHHKDKANHLTGSLTGSPKIATVTRPAYSEATIPTLYTDSEDSKYATEEDNPLFNEYANSVAGAKETIGKIFPNANMEDVELATLAVQGRETNFMNTRGSTLTGTNKLKYELRKAYRDKYKKADPETVSSDLSKMKLSSFSSNERQLLGIHKPEDLNNPSLAGRAALYLMAKNYDYFKRLQSAYPELGLQENDLRYLTELSYNQGMGILSSIGFKENGEIDLSEIEKIRKMAEEDAKVKDITSTNYKYLGAVGRFFYDKFGKGHTPYISAAEKNRKKLLAKAKQSSDLLTYNE